MAIAGHACAGGGAGHPVHRVRDRGAPVQIDDDHRSAEAAPVRACSGLASCRASPRIRGRTAGPCRGSGLGRRPAVRAPVGIRRPTSSGARRPRRRWRGWRIAAIARAAGISAPRQARVRVTLTSSKGLCDALRCRSVSSCCLVTGCAGGMRSATRLSSEAGSPIWRSAPTGPAISSRNTVPIDRPVTLLTTSPTRCPCVITCRSRLPRRRLGGERAGHLVPVARVLGCHRFVPTGQPAEWLNSWATVTVSLPLTGA
jgi:hypothetical protein